MAKLKMSVKTRKQAAWDAFSAYVRLRDCLETTGWPDVGRCCTCNIEYPIEELQAGHFLGGRKKQVLFSEEGVHAQCEKCNGKYGGGEPQKYFLFMERKYGRETIERLMAEKDQNQSGRWTPLELLEIQKHYEKKATDLARNQE